jgi:peptidyl-prolyl cis-trans isomerase SurA
MIKQSLVSLLLFAISFSQGQLVDGVVAIVDEYVILQSDVVENAQMRAVQDGVDITAESYKFNSYLESSLDEIINQKVFLGAAEKDTLVFISDEEVERALENHIQQLVMRAGSEKLLEDAIGSTLREFKKSSWNDVYQSLLTERYQQFFMQGVSVTRKEVEDFYKTYQDSLPQSSPSTCFGLIQISVQPGKEAEDAVLTMLSTFADSIREGGSFAEIALNFSEDPGSAEKGGELGFVRRGTLVKEYEEMAFSLTTGEISDPVKTSFGYHIIQVLDKQGEKINTRHILMTVKPNEMDRENTLVMVRDIYSLLAETPDLFDSIAVSLEEKNFGFSHPVSWKNDGDVSVEVMENISSLSDKSLSFPFEPSHDLFSIVWLDSRREGEVMTTENSWKQLKEMALQFKLRNKYNKLITQLKSKAYIKFF